MGKNFQIGKRVQKNKGGKKFLNRKNGTYKRLAAGDNVLVGKTVLKLVSKKILTSEKRCQDLVLEENFQIKKMVQKFFAVENFKAANLNKKI